MSGYLRTWIEAEQAAERARAQHPDCDLTVACPAQDGVNGGHLLDCRRFRRERYPEIYDRLSDYPKEAENG